MSVDVIIPVYKPDEKFTGVLKRLMNQTVVPDNVYLLETVEDGKEVSVHSEDERIKVYPVQKKDFDHGGTRGYGAKLSKSDYMLFMTQDAVPDDKNMIEKLLEMFQDEKVAVAYGRQLARKESGELERLTRVFNYPEESRVKSADDLEELGIKTYFCSDVCAMYRKSLYNQVGGFVTKTIFNEDMIIASRFINSGYKVAYCAEAKVIHSHSYTCKEQFVRNFDLGVSQSQYKEIFENISSEKEGAGYAKKTLAILLKQGKIFKAFYFAVQCAFKLFGYKLGKSYRHLPKKLILLCTMNKGYWK